MSTSNFKKLFVGILLTWLAIEGLLRTPLARLLPEPGTVYWYYGIVQYKLKQLESKAPVDVLFISSSVMWDAIIPSQFTAQVETLTGKKLTAYNAGLPLLDANTSQMALDEKLLAINGQPPGYLVYGVSFSEMAQHGWHDDAVNALQGLTVAPTGNSFVSRAKYWVFQNVYILRYRTSLQIPFRVTDTSGEDTDEFGFHQTTHTFNPDEYFAASDQNLKSYALDDQQFNYLRQLAEYCKTKNMRLVLLDLPHHPALFQLNRIPSALVEAYHQQLMQIAQQYDIPLLDLSKNRTAWMDDGHYYYDELHVNSLGAAQVTEEFAQFFAGLIR